MKGQSGKGVGKLKQKKGENRPILGNRIRDETQSESHPHSGQKRDTRFALLIRLVCTDIKRTSSGALFNKFAVCNELFEHYFHRTCT